MAETKRFELHWPTVRQLFATELRDLPARPAHGDHVAGAAAAHHADLPFRRLWNERQREERIEKQTVSLRDHRQRGRAGPRADPRWAAPAPRRVAGRPGARPARPTRRRPGRAARRARGAAGPPSRARSSSKREPAFRDRNLQRRRGEGAGASRSRRSRGQGERRRPGEARPPKPLAELPLPAGWSSPPTGTIPQTAAGAMLGRARDGARARPRKGPGRRRLRSRRREEDPADRRGEGTSPRPASAPASSSAASPCSTCCCSLLTGGSVIAADTIAGEKERGSLETLLTSAASRIDIVTAKMLLILAGRLGDGDLPGAHLRALRRPQAHPAAREASRSSCRRCRSSG